MVVACIGSVSFCRNCDRFLSPPAQWTIAQPESRELLAICLKKLKGLNKVRLVDAGFIWTEPHSKRIKVKLTIQKEVRLVVYYAVKRSSRFEMCMCRCSPRLFYNKYFKWSIWYNMANVQIVLDWRQRTHGKPWFKCGKKYLTNGRSCILNSLFSSMVLRRIQFL